MSEPITAQLCEKIALPNAERARLWVEVFTRVAAATARSEECPDSATAVSFGLAAANAALGHIKIVSEDATPDFPVCWTCKQPATWKRPVEPHERPNLAYWCDEHRGKSVVRDDYVRLPQGEPPDA